MKKIKLPSELPPEPPYPAVSAEFRAKVLIMRAAEQRSWLVCVFCETLEWVPEPIDGVCPQCSWRRAAVCSAWMDHYLLSTEGKVHEP